MVYIENIMHLNHGLPQIQKPMRLNHGLSIRELRHIVNPWSIYKNYSTRTKTVTDTKQLAQ